MDLDEDMNSEQMDEYMEDLEEQQGLNDQIKLPDDLEGEGEDNYNMGSDSDEGPGIFGDDQEEGELEFEEEKEEKQSEGDSDDVENEVFAMARENKELEYANAEMLQKIEKIENEMMEEKKWQMKGEVQVKDRNYNSLLEEFVDFDTASKAPPKVTQETTNQIEALIKQRILDEMFDDPIRRLAGKEGGKDDDF